MKKLYLFLLMALMTFVSFDLSAQTPCSLASAGFTSAWTPGTTVVNFTNTSDPHGLAHVSFVYSFGDGSTSPAGTSVLTHTYARLGTYVACIYMRGDYYDSTRHMFDTCRLSFCDTVRMTTLPPVTSVCDSVSATLHDLVSGTGVLAYTAVTTPRAAIITYTYNWGDGTPAVTSSRDSVTHSYGRSGTFNLCVDVRMIIGLDTCYRHQCLGVAIGSVSHVCDSVRVAMEDSIVGLEISAGAVVYAPGSSSVSYSWTFGDGTASTPAMSSSYVTHSYPRAGTYNLCLDVLVRFGADSCVRHECRTLVIGGGVIRHTPCDSSYVGYTASVSGVSATYSRISRSIGLTGVTYSWSFGDGSSSSSSSSVVAHTYTSMGAHRVCVSMTGYWYDSTLMRLDTCRKEYCSYVTVFDPSRCTSLHASATAEFAHDTLFLISHSNTDTCRIISYSWVVENMSTHRRYYTRGESAHIRLTRGLYNICLHIENSCRCVDDTCFSMSVGSSSCHDLGVNITRLTPRRGFTDPTYLCYYNADALPIGGAVVTYHYDADQIFVSSSPAATSHDAVNRLLIYNVGTVAPFSTSCMSISFRCDTSVAVGTLVHDTARIAPTDSDCILSNNVGVYTGRVTAAHDPNAKYVSPAGEGLEGFIPASTPELTYTVEFQNTGSADASRVVVEDVIDANLNLSSFRVVESTHPFTYSISGRTISFVFDSIKLTPALIDEANSKGVVVFNLALNSGLTAGTIVSNTADIYFDFEAAITTNTVSNKIAGSTGINTPDNVLQFLMYPNPARDMLNIKADHVINDVSIVDMQGRLVMQQDTSNQNAISVSLHALENGLYFVRIQSANAVQTRKLLIER